MKATRILVLGVAYKADIDDLRESPSLDIIDLLIDRGAKVDYHDPFVPQARTALTELRSVDLTEAALRSYDAIAICTGHHSLDYEWIVKHSALVFDARNATAKVAANETVVKL